MPESRNALLRSLAILDRDIRGDTDFGEIDRSENRAQARVRDKHPWRRLERGTDPLLRPLDLQRPGDDRTDAADLLPFFGKRLVAPRRRNFWERFEMHRDRLRVTRKPRLFRSENQDRREPQGYAAKNPLDRLKRSAPFFARRRLAIERVLANVEIKGRKIGVEESLSGARQRAYSRIAHRHRGSRHRVRRGDAA